MKIALLLLLFPILCTAQYKAVSVQKYVVRYDTTLSYELPQVSNSEVALNIRLKSNDNLLATVYRNNIIYFNAAVSTNDLAAIGSSGLTMLTMPSAINSTKGIMINSLLYISVPSTHAIVKNTGEWPAKIYRVVDSKLICEIFDTGIVLWHVIPTGVSTVGQGLSVIITP